MGYIAEALAIIFSSSGIVGGAFAVIIKRALKKASEDAERRRNCYKEEMISRYELDHAANELLIALTRYSLKKCSESELEIAEANYTAASIKADMTLKRNYISCKSVKNEFVS